ncbi:bifunctional Alpha-D-phosphohexomutase [Babesia duncani]|uniref:Bifunctional Alpha-D-phosphohexomutase n=1 Tax=Babesia duncani TaxID=323732 RepID=A0AAD9UQG2_9APIC|nr:bifunctional Alpha-D-phosphohexomutase [Babesia duncani]
MEDLLNEFINTRQPLHAHLQDIFTRFRVTKAPKITKATVLVGYDTRDSSSELALLYKRGVESMFKLLKIANARCTILGHTTTPTLPFMLSSGHWDAVDDFEYIQYINRNFCACVSLFADTLHWEDVVDSKEDVFYDCSYGIGGLKIGKICEQLKILGINACPIHITTPIGPTTSACRPSLEKHQRQKTQDSTNHTDTTSKNLLNLECGAHYVLSTKRAPIYILENLHAYKMKRFCSLDGDADRLIYYMPDAHGGICNLIDGIRILVLNMLFFHKLLSKVESTRGKPLEVGIVLTRYTNGGASAFIKDTIARWNAEQSRIKWTWQYANTGVKCMHTIAIKFDLALYYEYNGHGTVIYKSQSIENWLPSNPDKWTMLLHATLAMFKSPGGDALVNLLVFELVLKVMDMTIDKVMKIYNEMPCMHTTIKAPFEKIKMFKSDPNDESSLLQPLEIKNGIAKIVSRYPQARAFIRPSGTEPICRLYIEAPTVHMTQELNREITALVASFIN